MNFLSILNLMFDLFSDGPILDPRFQTTSKPKKGY